MKILIKKILKIIIKNKLNINNDVLSKNDNKINLLIGTTGLNRLDLHNDNIKEWCDFINLSKEFKVTWFLNIDVVPNLEFNYVDTVNNFKRQLSDNVKFIVLPKKEPFCKIMSFDLKKYL